MFSVFPELLSYWLFAPFLLRITLGIFFVWTALQHSRQRQVLQSVWPAWTRPMYSISIIFEVLLGALLVIGLYTQVAALVVAVYAVKMLIVKIARSQYAVWAPHNTFLYIMILAISLSLLVLGAGAFAFDLPL